VASASGLVGPNGDLITGEDTQLNVNNEVERLLSKKQSTVEGRMKS